MAVSPAGNYIASGAVVKEEVDFEIKIWAAAWPGKIGLWYRYLFVGSARRRDIIRAVLEKVRSYQGGMAKQGKEKQGMKRMILTLLAVMVVATGAAGAGELMPGQAASEWSFPDADGNMYTMENWAGKVLLINYVDPDEADVNDHYTDAMKAAKEEGRLKTESYKGIGIADCAASWKPNFLIRSIAGKKAKKYKTTILFDTEAALRNAWGLEKDTGNIILLDKNRVCRAIVRGPVPEDQVADLVDLAVALQQE